MCGVVAVVNCADEDTLARMTRVLAHRGPDDEGTWSAPAGAGGWVGLGSRRLSILDLSAAGHMPMQSADGRLTVVQNGEIYNYPELRLELEAKGHTFRSGSDTEVLLHLYREYGEECVHRLNGMFAFCVWDAEDGSLFVARDHFGIKPLYFCRPRGGVAFASEVKALLQLPDVAAQVDNSALQQYLTFLWVPEPRTIFAGIEKLPAGSWARYRGGELTVRQYWDLEMPPADHAFGGDERELVAELADRFRASVRAQMLSDAPIGAFLSAGLDSSGIVAAMAQATDEQVKTFTIAFPEKYRRGEAIYDDPQVARRTAESFGCRHTELLTEPDVASLLPQLVWNMDEPTADPALITAYLVCREARPQVKVLLSGVGGDEVFAGYRKYRGHYIAERYQRVPRPLRALGERLTAALPSFRGTRWRGHVRLAKKMARAGSLPPIDRFVEHSVYLDREELAWLAAPEWYAEVAGEDPRARHLACFERVAGADFLNQMLYVDMKTFMLSLNLNYNDKMSMATSVEVRVPFIDRELVEWVAWNIPPRLKLHDGTTKYLFRKAMDGVLSDEVLTQKKAGFGAPADYWLANDLREMTDDLLSEDRVKRRGIFRPAAVRRMIAEHRSGRRDWQYQLWQLLTLELWSQKFLDS